VFQKHVTKDLLIYIKYFLVFTSKKIKVKFNIKKSQSSGPESKGRFHTNGDIKKGTQRALFSLLLELQEFKKRKILQIKGALKQGAKFIG